MITIEKKIPIPEKKHRRKKYPFAEMQVGDSFELTISKSTLSSAAVQWVHRHNPKAKFTIRHNDGKTRIWRTR